MKILGKILRRILAPAAGVTLEIVGAVHLEGVAHDGVVAVAEPADEAEAGRRRTCRRPGNRRADGRRSPRRRRRSCSSPLSLTTWVSRHSSAAGRQGDARAGDLLAGGLGDLGGGELVGAGGEGSPTRRSSPRMPSSSTTLTQNTPVCSMLPSVSLPRSRSGLAPVVENITCGGVVGDAVEEGIGGEVVVPVGAAGRDPGDRPRRDDRVERVVRQAVAVFGAIEHGSVSSLGLPCC